MPPERGRLARPRSTGVRDGAGPSGQRRPRRWADGGRRGRPGRAARRALGPPPSPRQVRRAPSGLCSAGRRGGRAASALWRDLPQEKQRRRTGTDGAEVGTAATLRAARERAGRWEGPSAGATGPGHARPRWGTSGRSGGQRPGGGRRGAKDSVLGGAWGEAERGRAGTSGDEGGPPRRRAGRDTREAQFHFGCPGLGRESGESVGVSTLENQHKREHGAFGFRTRRGDVSSKGGRREEQREA